MILKWTDKKSVLKIGQDIYHAGEVLPAGSLSESRLALFKELNFIEEIEEPKKPVEAKNANRAKK